MEKLRDEAVEFPYDCKRIQLVLLKHGWSVSSNEAADLWERHSESYWAGWLFLYGTDDEIWHAVKPYLPE